MRPELHSQTTAVQNYNHLHLHAARNANNYQQLLSTTIRTGNYDPPATPPTVVLLAMSYELATTASRAARDSCEGRPASF